MQKKFYVPVAVIGLLLVWVGLAAAQEGDPRRGAALYAQNCAACHGPEGQGRTGANLSDDFSSIDETALVAQTIANGVDGTRMPAWSQANGGPLSDQEIADITAYVAGLLGGSEPAAPAPTSAVAAITPAAGVTGDPNAGAAVFAQNCTACHGERGQGRIGATLTKEWPAINPAAYIRSTVEQGVTGTLMPAWLDVNGGPLTARQIDDVSAFVVSLEPGSAPTAPTAAPPPGPLGGSSWIVWIVIAAAVVVVFVGALWVVNRQKS